MRLTIWTDPSGRRWRRGIPDDAQDAEGEWGVPAGPPDLGDVLESADWPEDLQVAIHNQLADRELWDARTLRRSGGHGALRTALLSAIRFDAERLGALYVDGPD